MSKIISKLLNKYTLGLFVLAAGVPAYALGTGAMAGAAAIVGAAVVAGLVIAASDDDDNNAVNS